MTCTDMFLDLYKQLEYIGRTKHFPNISESDSIIGRLINMKALEKYSEELNYCRVVRNFLTHNPRVGGSYPIEVSKEMVAFLKKLLKEVDNPPLAFDYAIKREDMLVISFKDNVIETLKSMHKKAYTHAPVFEKGKLLGIFSDEILSRYLCNEKGMCIDRSTTISAFREYIVLKNSSNRRFSFVAKNSPVNFVEYVFEENYRKNRIMEVVYITENGDEDEAILGMLTPWDLFNRTENSTDN